MAGKTENPADKLARMRGGRARSDNTPTVPTVTAGAPRQPEVTPALGGDTAKKSTLRSTVDLTPQMHYDLERWSQEAGQALGRARIARTDVFKELVRQLLTDETLSERVIAQIGARVSKH